MRNIQNNTLLGICIPTYNRSKYLEECLQSIEKAATSHDIKIYISDNASNDDTESVVRNYTKNYENITYHRNSSNVGLYRNILTVIKMANTDYIWLMGDDDAINNDGITIVSDYIKIGYDYLRLNSTQFDRDLEIVRSEKVIGCFSDILYPTGSHEKLLTDLKWGYHGFISSMILRTELLNSIISKYANERFELYDNVWFPTGLFFEAIIGKQGIFLCKPILKMRDNPRPSGKDSWNYVYVDHLKVIEYLFFKGYGFTAILRAMEFTLSKTIVTSINIRCEVKKTFLFNEYIRTHKMIPLHIKLIIFMIDKMPLFLVSIIKNIIDRIKSSVHDLL